MTHVYTEPTYAVFGDVGGHYSVLINSIEALGVYHDGNGYIIPKNLTIIQLGDLVNKGPDSDTCVSFVDTVINDNNDTKERGTWIQLIGNHESNYIPGAPSFWRHDCSPASIETIKHWWETKKAHLHYLIPQDAGKPFMVTHSGVGAYIYQAYQKDNDNPTVNGLTAYLEKLQPKNMRVAGQPGMMLTGRPSYLAGVFWAECIVEVYSTWNYFHDAPFHQIHGHSTPFMWKSGKFINYVSEGFRKEIALDTEKRHSHWENNDTHYYGIDPGFDTEYDRDIIHPLMLNSSGIISP